MQIQANPISEAEKTADAGTVSPCWSCKGPVRCGKPFCSTCECVQPPGQVDHFARLGLETSFDIDTAELERRYFDLQRCLHPDRFATCTARERALSQLQATSLNDAYETIRDPLSRADYLAGLMGTEVSPEGCNLVNDPSLLMEAMEMREALAQAETREEVETIAAHSKREMAACIEAISEAFAESDLERALGMTTRLKYLRKLFDETRMRKAKLANVG